MEKIKHVAPFYLEKMIQDVMAFRKRCVEPIGPTLIKPEGRMAFTHHKALLDEEYKEWKDAREAKDEIETLDAVVDYAYVYIGMYLHLGETPQVVDYGAVVNAMKEVSNISDELFKAHRDKVQAANQTKGEVFNGTLYPSFKFLNHKEHKDHYEKFMKDYDEDRLGAWLEFSKGKILKGSNFKKPY